MTETARFGLTLLEAAQAQKHVTVNEALARLDALAAARVEALGVTAPPAGSEGEVWGVGAGAGGDWAGQDGRLALWLNGGWAFADPVEGWQVWNAASASRWTRVDGGWVEAAEVESPGGARSFFRIAETDHAVGAGPTSDTAAFIPDKAVVFAVTARVIAPIGGAASWSLGVVGSPGRYGGGFGTGAGAVAEGVTSEPIAYFGGAGLRLTASGGAFAGGTVRLAAHYLAVSPPAPG